MHSWDLSTDIVTTAGFSSVRDLLTVYRSHGNSYVTSSEVYIPTGCLAESIGLDRKEIKTLLPALGSVWLISFGLFG